MNSQPLYPVFVYATLKKETLVKHILHRDVKERQAILSGWRRLMGTWPTIIRDANSFVLGDMFYVTKPELNKLDAYEERYKRQLVEISTGHRNMPAWAYVLKRGEE